MLDLILESTEENVHVYKYYPESGELFGLVTIDQNGDAEIKQLSSHPYDEFKKYAFHALRRLREYHKHQDFKQKDLVAWG